MTFHLIGWTESHDNTADTDLQPLVDDILLIQNGHYVLNADHDVIFASSFNADIVRTQINQPSIRQVSPRHIFPLMDGAEPIDSPNVDDMRANPFRLRSLEEIVIENTHDNVGSIQCTVIAGIRRGGSTPAPTGDIYRMRGTSATAAVANVWTTIAITWQDTLPKGVWAVVGLTVIAVVGRAARLIFEDQIERPGSLSTVLVANEPHPMFLNGGLGEWGRFESHRMPNVQVLNNTTTATHTAFLDFVRVG